MAKQLTAEEIDHVAQIAGLTDPTNTLLSDGRTVAEAQAAARAVNNAWHAVRVAAGRRRQRRAGQRFRQRELARNTPAPAAKGAK